jgi:hypothetical protein
MQNQIPTFRQIYYNDLAFKSLIQLIYGPLVFWAAIFFIEPMFRLIVTAMTFPLSLLGIIFSIYRYKSIRNTFEEGVTVKGKMLFREHIVSNSKNSSGSYSKKRSYYITVGYHVNGVEYKQRIRLPDAPFLYGIDHEGQEFDLVLKETSPKNVLIKHLYLEYDPSIPHE